MKSRNYAGISLLASLAACNSATAETVQKNSTQDPKKPNVIVILADDLGYGDLKCYGAKNVETPHVDKLASEGIRFTNAHTVAATSTPSRYSLLTGEYAWQNRTLYAASHGYYNVNRGQICQPFRLLGLHINPIKLHHNSHCIRVYFISNICSR